MKIDEKLIPIKKMMVRPNKKVKMKDFDTAYKGKILNKQESEKMLEASRKYLADVQDKLYAHNRYSVLIIFQAMDAAGKDGAVKHIMSGFNPLGVKVYSFKAPNAFELDHDYLWRHELALPARGEIAIHNRSHYENVLATKVHPQWILNENIPGIESVEKVNDKFWEQRYKQIRRFEKNLADNGMIIMKFFLNVSKKEQKKRFLERIEDPSKNWKFSLSDLKERVYWDDYQKAYEMLMGETSTDHAPWFVIPADDKWYARLAIASIITKHFDKLELSYPVVSQAQKQELQKAKVQLLDEAEGKTKPKKEKNNEVKRKLRMGMVGGGLTSFIGPVHRKAAGIDGQIELVCGAFSIDPKESKETGASLYLDPNRVYATYPEMFEKEKKLPADKRIDFVSVVTPNHVHYAPTKLALESGFHVVVEKPIAFSLAEAKSLQKLVDKSGLILALTHTYTGYPMVKEARQMVKSGKFGKIRKVYVEYPQGWLSGPLEKTGNMQASWRTDPKQSGMGGAIGDIGTHAANLAEYITGSDISEVCTMLNTVVTGRMLDDDTSMLVKFDNGATGVLLATQVAAGEENNLNIRIYGEKGGLEWKQEEPSTLVVKWLDKPKEIHRAGWKYLSDEAKGYIRTPAGHPEGYLEAFANIYRSFTNAVHDYKPGKKINAEKYDFPDVHHGVRGMTFVETVVKSAQSNKKWVKIK